MKYTFHVPGVATTESNDLFVGCPYTTPMRLLIKGLVANGHNVIHYCNPNSETEAEDIIVTPENVLVSAFGQKHYQQYHADPKPEPWERVRRSFSIAAAAAIRQNINSGDFVLLPSDGVQDIIELLNDIEDIRFVETNIGYNDPVAEYRIFETNTWRSFWRGRADRAQEIFDIVEQTSMENGHINPINHNPHVMVPVSEARWGLDTAIFFLTNPEYFKTSEKKDNYFLFLGRIIENKGILEAVELTEKLGKKLIVAGPGNFEQNIGIQPPKHVEFVGMADKDKRAEFLSRAECLLALTRYNEPCGAIVMEAGWSECPVITSNCGGFTETVEEGINGFRGDCHADWVDAAERLGELDPKAIRQHAEQTFHSDVLLPKYERFWKRVDALCRANDLNFVYQ